MGFWSIYTCTIPFPFFSLPLWWAIIALPLPCLVWFGAIVHLPLPCRCHCHIHTATAIIGLSPCHWCQCMSLTLDTSPFVVLANADTNVLTVSIRLWQRQCWRHCCTSLTSQFNLQQPWHCHYMTVAPTNINFSLPLSFLDAVVDADSIISIHVNCCVLILFIKILRGSWYCPVTENLVSSMLWTMVPAYEVIGNTTLHFHQLQ